MRKINKKKTNKILKKKRKNTKKIKETINVNTVAEVVVKRIKEILSEKGMSIYRLEKITAMSHSTMQTLMRADNNSVNLKTVLLVIRGLGISTAEFFNSPLFDDEDLDID